MIIDCSNKSTSEVKGVVDQITEEKRKIIEKRLDDIFNYKKGKIEESLGRYFKKGKRLDEGTKPVSGLGPCLANSTFPFLEKGKQASLTENVDTLNKITDTLTADFAAELGVSEPFKGVIFSWASKSSSYNTSDLDGAELEVKELSVQERKDTEHFIILPRDNSIQVACDPRTYGFMIYFERIGSPEIAKVVDAMNDPANHVYYILLLRKHKNSDATGNTAIQECMQGLACQLAFSDLNKFSKRTPESETELIKLIRERVVADNFRSVTISGGTVSVVDFDVDKMETYLPPAARTGIAFAEYFGNKGVTPSSFSTQNLKVYHPKLLGSTFDKLLELGGKRLGGLPKDCWNPTDILITDFTAKDVANAFAASEYQDLAHYNQIMNKWIKQEDLPEGRKWWIPLSLKLNYNDKRDSVVEELNLEAPDENKYKVYSHFVKTNGVCNEIDIYANISGLKYKFFIRCNGTDSAIIEGQHATDSQYYSASDKAVGVIGKDEDNNEVWGLSDTDNIQQSDKARLQADIEGFLFDTATNTDSFLGKAKAILFSTVGGTREFKKEKNKIKVVSTSVMNDPEISSIKANLDETSLPWRLVDLSEKILAYPETKADGKKNGHSNAKALLVSEVATDLAKLIVKKGWTTEQALIYLLVASQKENYGAFNTFAPYYKIS